jgi:hypothetical protein
MAVVCKARQNLEVAPALTDHASDASGCASPVGHVGIVDVESRWGRAGLRVEGFITIRLGCRNRTSKQGSGRRRSARSFSWNAEQSHHDVSVSKNLGLLCSGVVRGIFSELRGGQRIGLVGRRFRLRCGLILRLWQRWVGWLLLLYLASRG